MKKFNNILLYGGITKNENMPVGFYSSYALLFLHSKPIIWWQLETLEKQGLSDFIILISKENEKLLDYAEKVLKENFPGINVVVIEKSNCIIDSMKFALNNSDLSIPTRIILGDTLIPHSISNDIDVVYTSSKFSTSENWCLIEKDNNGFVTKFYDKKKYLSIENKEVLVGYYSFSDTKFILDCCEKSDNNCKEISNVLEIYKQKYPLKAKLIEDWYDVGHTSGLIQAKNNLFVSRCFNSITTNVELGTLTKISKKIDKLKDEVYWYQNIPDDLKVLAPRLINFEVENQLAKLTQELYGYPSLQELYLSGNVNIEDWKFIIEKLFDVHKYFEKYQVQADKSAIEWLYSEKTKERIAQLVENSSYWRDLFSKKNVKINGKEYNGIAVLLNSIEKKVKELSEDSIFTVIHGDYCFSNILFDASNYIFKFIDPRGRLNKGSTIYGDPRYDIAKLRHSVVGLYDFIVNDLFKLSENEDSFEYKIINTNDYSMLEKFFDEIAIKNNYDLSQIKFIEGLLFLSMIPIHKENFQRQIVFFCKAIEILNECINISKPLQFVS